MLPVNVRLLEACTGEVLEDVPRTVESIFAEITAVRYLVLLLLANQEEKSPYYSIYPYLLRDDWEGLINWMVEYVEGRISSESRMDDQLIRFMAALATVARIKQHQHDVSYHPFYHLFQEVAASTLFTLLIDQLVSKSIFAVIPFYASFLPRDIANDRLLDIMERKKLCNFFLLNAIQIFVVIKPEKNICLRWKPPISIEIKWQL